MWFLASTSLRATSVLVRCLTRVEPGRDDAIAGVVRAELLAALMAAGAPQSCHVAELQPCARPRGRAALRRRDDACGRRRGGRSSCGSMQLRTLSPAAALAPFVTGYWVIEDLAGAHAGRPITTAPHAGAVLTVHLGRPNTGEFAAAPRASLLGVQSRARTWWSSRETAFVMCMFSVPGLARLLPGAGASGDDLLELGGLLGDAAVRGLADALGCLDRWLLARLAARRPTPGLARHVAAYHALRRTGRVDAAAAAAQLSARQLERWFALHVGHGPKQLLGLDRVQASLRAAQRGAADPRAGFSDQAHQIRSWRRHLGVTPGRYARSQLAEHFADSAPLAHYL